MSEKEDADTSRVTIDSEYLTRSRKRKGAAPTLQDVIASLGNREKDPKFDVYFEECTTQAQRDSVFRAIMYFAGRPPRSNAPAYAAIVSSLHADFSLATNKSQESPLEVRLASGKQIANLLRFLDSHKNVIWGEGEAAIRFWCRIEGSQFYPARY
jgi:hypothetical protein